jgi:rRNA maturation RNase YbeY
MNTISFFASSAKIPLFKRREFRKNVEKFILSKKKRTGKISYVFCTDEELLSINKKYLNHDTYTDIITFDYSGDVDIVLGENIGESAGRDAAKAVNFDNRGSSGNISGVGRVPPVISGDIFISVERVRENAKKYGVPFRMELLRVMIHGILHLLGLKDKTPAEEKKMRAAENDVMRRFFKTGNYRIL